MPEHVLLQNIIDALEVNFDEYRSFVDLDSGQVETIALHLLNQAEQNSEQPNLPAWQTDEWQTVLRIVSSDRFRALPSQFDVNEWELMQHFALEIESTKTREELLNAMRGPGAFRHFKDALHRHNIEKQWYACRTEALKQIAIDWCKENQIAWK